MLSKRESKYKQKLIYTYHLNKIGQNELYEYIHDNNVSYKNTYFEMHKYNLNELMYGFNNYCNILNQIGVCIKNPDNTFRPLGDVLSEAAEKWKELKE